MNLISSLLAVTDGVLTPVMIAVAVVIAVLVAVAIQLIKRQGKTSETEVAVSPAPIQEKSESVVSVSKPEVEQKVDDEAARSTPSESVKPKKKLFVEEE